MWAGSSVAVAFGFYPFKGGDRRVEGSIPSQLATFSLCFTGIDGSAKKLKRKPAYFSMVALLSFETFLSSYRRHPSVKKFKQMEPWFPICSSPILAGLIADLMGDGHLQAASRWQIFFTSNSKVELLRFENVLFNLFNVKGKIHPCTTNKYGTMNYTVSCAPLARMLYQIGVPAGEKVSQKYEIPAWVLEDRECFRRFVQRYFDCEGSVSAVYGSINVKMYKTDFCLDSGFAFMVAIRNGLNRYFGIITSNPFLGGGHSVRKDGSVSHEITLKIKRKDSILKFKECIQLETPHKSHRLELIATRAF